MDNHLRTLQKKRTANFREDETKLLIQLWGSPSIQNKLFLTHRKAPVMRLLAANMQQRGFYRTPDEIKTRIRNLKCLYHRIKRTMSCGTGIGTVDPDWPHFKAMDEILSKDYPRKLTDRILEEQLEAPKFEDVQVKQEVDDIDIDDNDSWATNESLNSEYDEESQPSTSPPMPLINKPHANTSQAGTIQVKKTSSLQAPQASHSSAVSTAAAAGGSMATGSHVRHIPLQPPAAKMQSTVLPTIQLPNAQNGAAQKGTIPFPLLILNNLNADKNGVNRTNATATNNQSNESVASLLKELIAVQKESLGVTKEKLEVEKQRLEFDRLIGAQMVTLIPMLGGLLQRLGYAGNQGLVDLKFDIQTGVKRKRSASEEAELLKDSKILRSMLEQGIRKYMIVDDDKEEAGDEKESVEDAPAATGPPAAAAAADDGEEKSDNELEVDEEVDEEAEEKPAEKEDDAGNEAKIDDEEDDDEDDDDDDDDDQPLVIDARRSPRVYRRKEKAGRTP